MKVIVEILPSSPRFETWKHALGTTRVEVLSAIPVLADLPEKANIFCYRADVSKLSDDQIGRMAIQLAAQFKASPAEIEADIRGEHGLPIIADNTECTIEEDFI
jgi:hypothetical protein